MNIFATEQGILGDTDYARQHNTFQAFLTLARSIRKRLGARAYKLDEYIRQLLIACSIPLEEEFFDREGSPTDALGRKLPDGGEGRRAERFAGKWMLFLRARLRAGASPAKPGGQHAVADLFLRACSMTIWRRQWKR